MRAAPAYIIAAVSRGFQSSVFISKELIKLQHKTINYLVDKHLIARGERLGLKRLRPAPLACVRFSSSFMTTRRSAELETNAFGYQLG